MQLEGRRAELANGAVSGCSTEGIRLDGSGGHVVKNVLVEDSGKGFDIGSRSVGNTLLDNVSRANATGFDVNAKKSRLVRNTATESAVGFELENGVEGSELIGNVATGPGDGFSLDSTTRNVELRGNLSLGQGEGAGFGMNGRGHRLTGNRAIAHEVGISVGATETLVSNNVAIQNELDLADDADDCDHNRWRDNVFTTSDRPCIR